MQLPHRLAACLLVAVFAVSAAGCGDAPTAPVAAPPQVTVAMPLSRRIVDWDGYVGQFEAIEHVEVRPRVTGYLVDVHFSDGQMVEQDDPMFTIDPRPFAAALDEARSRAAGAGTRLDNARTELERARGLVEIRAVSAEEFEAQEAAVRTAEAELEAARAAVRAKQLDVGFTEVVAPISGRASYRRLDAGNAVKADETVLTTIVSVDPIHFVFQGSEALFLKYKRRDQVAENGASPVRIRLQDEPRYQWQGRLDFVDNAIDADSGTIRGRALVANPDGFLTPGMFGHMQLQATAEYEGLLLPDTAIATRGAQRIVYVVDDDGLVAAKEVVLGPINEGLRVIRSGLSARDRVIIDGQQRARPGQTVAALERRVGMPAGDDADAIVAADAPSARD